MTRMRGPTRFTVIGRGKFPIDMLRYDSCWPAKSEDARTITATFDEPRDPRETFEIGLMQAAGYGEPTVARWDSFGWKVQS